MVLGTLVPVDSTKHTFGETCGGLETCVGLETCTFERIVKKFYVVR